MKNYFLVIGLLFPFLAAQAENGVFATVEGGYANLQGLPGQSDVNAIKMDNNDNLGIRGALGYIHDLCQHFGLGLEAALGKYGDTVYTYADGSNNTVKSSTSEFLAIMAFHANPKLDFFVKAGEVRNRMEVYGVNTPATGAKIQPEAAISAAFNFNKNLATTLTYGHIFGTQFDSISDIGGAAPSIDMVLLGLRYTFAASRP